MSIFSSIFKTRKTVTNEKICHLNKRSTPPPKNQTTKLETAISLQSFVRSFDTLMNSADKNVITSVMFVRSNRAIFSIRIRLEKYDFYKFFIYKSTELHIYVRVQLYSPHLPL